MCDTDVLHRGGDELRPLHASDVAMARRVLAREPAALADFTQRMECVPRFLAVRHTRLGGRLDDSELEDVAQDALTTIWRKLGEFRGEARLETWACQFVEFELRNRLRRQARRRGIADADLSAADGVAVTTRDPAQELEPVYVALAELRPEEAVIVRLKHFEGLTFDEIGVRLGCSPNTVKTRYYRAIENLRAHLRHQPGREA